jgi:MFS family permease
LVLGAAGLAQVLVAKALPFIVRRWGEERCILLGAGLMGGAYLWCARALSPASAAAGAALLGAGFSVCHSTLQARATEVFPRGRGRALALFAFSLFLGGGAGTFLTARLCEAWGYERCLTAAGLAFFAFGFVASRVPGRTEASPATAPLNAKATR